MPLFELTDDLVARVGVDSGQAEIYDTQFPVAGSFGLRVGSGGRKSFFAVLRVRGRRKRLTLGQWPLLDVETARDKALRLVREVEEGRDPVAEQRRYRRLPNFGEVAEGYLVEVAAQHCKPSTLREYRRLINRELLPLWSDLSIADIESDEIAQVLVSCALERGKVPLANRLRALIGSILQYAIARGFILSNPARDTERMQEHAEPLPPLDFPALQQLWTQLGSQRDRASVALKVLFLTLQPISHILRMRWSELQIDAWHPDADRSRPIHLHAALLADIRQFQNRQGSEEYIFADSTGRPPRDLRKQCAALSERTKIAPLNSSILRRSLERELILLGVRPEIIAYIFGRKTLLAQFTRGQKQRDFFAESQKTFAKLAVKLNGEKAPEPSGGGKVIPLFGAPK